MNDTRHTATAWQSSWTEISGQPAHRVTLSSHGRAVTSGEVVDAWMNDEAFRTFFLGELRLTPFTGFFWELPPLQRETLTRPYEHVLLEEDLLEDIAPDPAAEQQLEETAQGASRPSLGPELQSVVLSVLQLQEVNRPVGAASNDHSARSKGQTRDRGISDKRVLQLKGSGPYPHSTVAATGDQAPICKRQKRHYSVGVALKYT
jgi:hypothetical protein